MKTTLALLLLAAGAWPASGFGQATTAPAPAAAATPAPAPPSLLYPSNVPDDTLKARRETALHSKWNILVDLQMVAMEEGKALDLIPELESDDQAKVDAAFAKLQTMIKAKEAILLAWPMVRAVDGGRSVSESITEKRYATEYESPLPLKAGSAAPGSPIAPVDKPVIDDAIPTAFETRNIGATLEVEAIVVDEGKRVHLDLVPQRVELLDMEKNESTITNGKTVVQEFQPIFASSKTTEAMTVSNSHYQLVGVHKLTKPANYIELHLVRAAWAKAE